MIARFIILFLRYGAAILLLHVVLVTTYLPILDERHMTTRLIVGSSDAFCGVFLGSFCLEPAGRRFGAILLFFLGPAFYVTVLLAMAYRVDGFLSREAGRMAPLAIGGLIAVAVIFKGFSTKRDLEPIHDP